MASGRRERIVIACVTFDVAKIVEPAVYYEATRVHLIHFGEGVYREFFDEVQSRIREELPRAEIIDHVAEVYDFSKMLNVVLTTISKEKEKTGGMVDIYVNVSAGTSEYSAAALMASMMADGVMPFNVPTSEYQVSDSRIKEVYYTDGKPVGLAKACKEPVMISTYSVEKPDEKQVLALGIVDERLRAKQPITAVAIIPELAKEGLINMSSNSKGSKPDQKTIMNYQRNFVDRWIDNGWIVRTSRRSMAITPDGRMVLDVFLEGYRIHR